MSTVQAAKTSDSKTPPTSTAVDDWRAFDEKRLDIEREWQPGDMVPSLEVTDRFFRVICKDPNSPDCVSYGGAPSKKAGSFPGIFVYREGMRELAESERELPLDDFHLKKVTEERARQVKLEAERKARSRK